MVLPEKRLKRVGTSHGPNTRMTVGQKQNILTRSMNLGVGPHASQSIQNNQLTGGMPRLNAGKSLVKSSLMQSQFGATTGITIGNFNNMGRYTYEKHIIKKNQKEKL